MSYWKIRRRVHAIIPQYDEHASQSESDVDEHILGSEGALWQNDDCVCAHGESSSPKIYDHGEDFENSSRSVNIQIENADPGEGTTRNETNFNAEQFEQDMQIQLSSSESDDSDSGEKLNNLHEILNDWTTCHKITQSSVPDLLGILRDDHPDLPKDVRSLLHADKTNPHWSSWRGILLSCWYPGCYQHTVLNGNPSFQLQEEIPLHINNDGVPFFKSTNDQLWPILGMLINPNIKIRFLIGIFHGSKKLSSIEIEIPPNGWYII